jgi:hypothetical protein
MFGSLRAKPLMRRRVYCSLSDEHFYPSPMESLSPPIILFETLTIFLLDAPLYACHRYCAFDARPLLAGLIPDLAPLKIYTSVDCSQVRSGLGGAQIYAGPGPAISPISIQINHLPSTVHTTGNLLLSPNLPLVAQSTANQLPLSLYCPKQGSASASTGHFPRTIRLPGVQHLHALAIALCLFAKGLFETGGLHHTQPPPSPKPPSGGTTRARDHKDLDRLS